MTQWLKFARSIVLRLQSYLFLRCLSSCHSTCHSSLASSAGNLRRVATTRDLWKRHVDTFHLQTPHVAHPPKHKQSLICFSQILSKWWVIINRTNLPRCFNHLSFFFPINSSSLGFPRWSLSRSWCTICPQSWAGMGCYKNPPETKLVPRPLF